MTKNKWLYLAAVVSLVLAASMISERSYTQDDSLKDDVDSNVYVILYKQRLRLTMVSLDRQKATLAYEKERVARRETLARRNEVSREELEEAQLRYISVQMAVAEGHAKVTEAEAMLSVIRHRVEIGMEVPICGNVGG